MMISDSPSVILIQSSQPGRPTLISAGLAAAMVPRTLPLPLCPCFLSPSHSCCLPASRSCRWAPQAPCWQPPVTWKPALLVLLNLRVFWPLCPCHLALYHVNFSPPSSNYLYPGSHPPPSLPKPKLPGVSVLGRYGAVGVAANGFFSLGKARLGHP